jgi:excisionase family DNA binding protein
MEEINRDQLWTIVDVARYLSVQESAVRRWIYEHRIRFLKVGRLIRFVPQHIIDDARKSIIGVYVTESSTLKTRG